MKNIYRGWFEGIMKDILIITKLHGISAGLGVGLTVIFNLLFGSFDMRIKILLIMMGLDLASGLVLAIFFKNSSKTENGRVSSDALFTGIGRKIIMGILVAASYQIDLITEANGVVRTAAILCFVSVESISLIENAGLMGVPIPKKLIDTIAVLKSNSEASEEDIKNLNDERER